MTPEPGPNADKRQPRWQRLDRLLDLLLIGLPLLLCLACILLSFLLRPYEMATGDPFMDWYGTQLLESSAARLAGDPLIEDARLHMDGYLEGDFALRFGNAPQELHSDPRFWEARYQFQPYDGPPPADLHVDLSADPDAAHDAVLQLSLASPAANAELLLSLKTEQIHDRLSEAGEVAAQREGRPRFLWRRPDELRPLLERCDSLPLQDSFSCLLLASYWVSGGDYPQARRLVLRADQPQPNQYPDLMNLLFRTEADPNELILAGANWNTAFPSGLSSANSDMRGGIDEIAELAWLAGDTECLDALRRAVPDPGRGQQDSVLDGLINIVNLGKVDMHIMRITDDPQELAMLLELRQRRDVWKAAIHPANRPVHPARMYYEAGLQWLDSNLSGGHARACDYNLSFGAVLFEEAQLLQSLQADWDAFALYSYTDMAFPDGWQPSATDLSIAEGQIASETETRLHRISQPGTEQAQ
ncbi:MAG: hypothetical protein R3F46_15085 [bacterium]